MKVSERKNKFALLIDMFLPIALNIVFRWRRAEVRMADDVRGSGEETSLLKTFELDEERLAEFRDYVKRRDTNL